MAAFGLQCALRPAHSLPRQTAAMGNLGRYIYSCFVFPGAAGLGCPNRHSSLQKQGRRRQRFDALEWLAAMCSHVPDKGEQMVRYYGYYSNVFRGKREKTGGDAVVAYVLEPPMPDKAFCRNWARLIQKFAACPGHDPGRLIPWYVPGAKGKCG